LIPRHKVAFPDDASQTLPQLFTNLSDYLCLGIFANDNYLVRPNLIRNILGNLFRQRNVLNLYGGTEIPP